MGKEITITPWLTYLPVVHSTNDEVRTRLESGAGHGVAICAGEQTGGRGRHGRQWFSPPGTSLYLSVGLRGPDLPNFLHRIPLAAAVACANALLSFTGINPGIKWPNDLLWRDRKLGGILCEALSRDNRVYAAVVGIGLNVSLPLEQLPVELHGRAASMHEFAGESGVPEIPALASRIHQQLLQQVEFLRDGDAAQLLDRVRELDVTAGRRVSFEDAGGIATGMAIGLEPDGALRVRTEPAHPGMTSEERVIRSGEVLFV
jgi:BirA family transcriptional regulator, biotin operon repressor / biotin---[acetyl-CoA-carboxylase] ligase